MNLRDEAETVLRAWDALERGRGGEPVIDFDCAPTDAQIVPAPDRLDVYRRLRELRGRASGAVAARLDGDLAYLGALLGEHRPLDEYVRATQGCAAAGWPEEYVVERGERARAALESLGVSWGAATADELERVEVPLPAEEAGEAIRRAAEHYEPAVRALTGATASYTLTIETVEVDAYWAFWLDGAGERIRLRLNLANARFTEAGVRRFALHEVLGHGLQSVGIGAHGAGAPWPRLLSVHVPYQVALEGPAQAMPLFVAADDPVLTARVRLDHYVQLVRAELHLAVGDGADPAACADHARSRVPWWSDRTIADQLSDRGADPSLRSYLWAYPAGLDWFAALAEADTKVIEKVFHALYRAPLTPAELAGLHPAGPPVGGPGRPVRLRAAAVP
ncbi:hypothetical protein [Actinocorallia populi]|uniref:hypothetical protein n=1 Tax=Actinocorallia populi TaxID=2079200 RepID=UPI001300B179|nr:hypothetical protein [Actinocorallia populi]